MYVNFNSNVHKEFAEFMTTIKIYAYFLLSYLSKQEDRTEKTRGKPGCSEDRGSISSRLPFKHSRRQRTQHTEGQWTVIKSIGKSQIPQRYLVTEN